MSQVTKAVALSNVINGCVAVLILVVNTNTCARL